MKHWTTKHTDITGVSTSRLAVECTIYDDFERPVATQVTSLLSLVRSLTITLPVQRTIMVDRPGAI